MNIFSSLKSYVGSWEIKDRRDFCQEEIASINDATVVPSTYGSSVCFTMKSGAKTYIPLSRDSKYVSGEKVDLTKVCLLTLSKSGEEDIYRIKEK